MEVRPVVGSLVPVSLDHRTYHTTLTMPPGRPSILTDELQTTICDMIRANVHIEIACKVANVGSATFYRWMKQGEDEPDSRYGEFREAILLADAQGEANLVILEARKAREDSKSRHWLLTHRYADRWAVTRKLEVTGSGGGALEVSLEGARRELVEAIAQVVESRGEKGSSGETDK